VAGAVGVTPPAIYKHFDDKTELVYAVCQRTFARLDDAIETAAATTDDPVTELRERGKAYVRFGIENPEHYRILFMTRPASAPADWDHAAIMGSAAFDHHLGAVVRAVEAGALPEGTDPMLVAIGLWVAVHGITSLRIAMPTFPWPPLDDLVDHVLATQARGLGAM
jgi:AcrR family transcriptional regulator